MNHFLCRKIRTVHIDIKFDLIFKGFEIFKIVLILVLSTFPPQTTTGTSTTLIPTICGQNTGQHSEFFFNSKFTPRVMKKFDLHHKKRHKISFQW